MKVFWATVKARGDFPVRHITSIALRRYTITEDNPNRFSLTVTHAENGSQIFRQGAFRTLEAAKIWAHHDIHLLRATNPQKHLSAPRTIARNASLAHDGAHVPEANWATAGAKKSAPR